MLKSTLATQLATELDDPSNTDLLALIKEWIDEVVADMAVRFQMEILNVSKEITLSSGSITATVSDVKDIISMIRKDTDEVIPKVNQNTMMNYSVDYDDTGPPYGWFVDSYDPANDQYTLKFNQLADQNYDLVLACIKDIGPLADTDHIPFINDLLFTVKNGVRGIFYLHEEKPQQSALYEGKYERGIRNYLQSFTSMSGTFVGMSQNTDLHFTEPRSTYDINLDKDRIITES